MLFCLFSFSSFFFIFLFRFHLFFSFCFILFCHLVDFASLNAVTSVYSLIDEATSKSTSLYSNNGKQDEPVVSYVPVGKQPETLFSSVNNGLYSSGEQMAKSTEPSQCKSMLCLLPKHCVHTLKERFSLL